MKKIAILKRSTRGLTQASVFLAVLMACLLVLSGCALLRPRPAYNPDEPKPSNNQGKPDQDTDDAVVYFIRGEQLGVAARTIPVGQPLETQLEKLVEQLLAGPNDVETEFGLTTTIPSGTALLGISIDGKVATVDLSTEYESGGGSLSMLLRVAQIVWTVTQFDGVEQVAFALDGTPVDAIGGEGIIVKPALSRADCEGQAPAILVEQPTINQEIESPLVISGTANTFEAQFMVDVVDPEGLILKTVPVMATSGTGTRGTFSATIPFETTRKGLGAIIFYESSAKDGKPINVVEIPIQMAP